MLDPRERERATAPNDGAVCDKDVSTVRRLECDAHTGLRHNGVKVATNRMLHPASAWLCYTSSPPEEDPNFVPQEVTCSVAPYPDRSYRAFRSCKDQPDVGS